jgi:hypothetical protein
MEINRTRRTFLSDRPSASGVVIDLTDPENESAALAAIRRRVDVEKLAWRFRAQSP